MSQISGTSGFAAILTIVSLEFLAPTAAVHAAIPSAAPIQINPQSSLRVKQLMAGITQAIRAGNLSLAAIELKNAIRAIPDNGEFHTLLGAVYLKDEQASAAEHELREGRLDGAKDQDVVPLLLQSMVLSKEWRDILDQFPDPAPGDKSSLAANVLSAKALAYESIGDDADAVSSINRSLVIERDVNGLLMRGRIAILESSSSDAMTYVNQALALAPNNPDALLMKAQILSTSDKNAALAIVDGVLKAQPNALNAVNARIELLIELGRNDEAQGLVNSVLSRYPDLAFAIFYKAVLLGIHNKPLDGWRIAQSLPSEFIQSEALTAVAVAKLAEGSGNLESANSILTTYVHQHPTIIEARLSLAGLHLKMNLPSDALNDLEPLTGSKDPEVLELIATTYASLNRQSDALTYLHKADAAGAKSGALKYSLATADLNQGNFSQGTQELLDGLKMQPGDLNMAGTGIDLLLKSSKFSEAQAVADQAEQTNPKSPTPPFFKGEIFLAQGKMDESLAAFNQSLQRDSHYAPALLGKADAFVAQYNYAEATKALARVQEQQPNNPLPYEKLAQIAASSKQVPQTIALLKQAISKDPKNVTPRLMLARYQMGFQQYADAEATLKTSLQDFPNDAQALALYGQVQQLRGETTAAIATDKVLVDKNQQSGAAQFQLANSLQKNGVTKGAVAAFRRATELNPDIIQYRTSLIDAQIQAGDSEGALATARGWQNSHKGSDGAFLLAETLARLKRFPQALATIATSQRVQPDWRLTVLDSQIAMATGHSAQAISILKNWLTDHAGDISVRQAYANALAGENDNAGALAQYEIIMKSRSDIPEVLNNIAWQVRDTDPSRALTLASKAMQLEPNSPDIDDTLGVLLIRNGNAKDALSMLQQAHAIEPTSGEISYHLALALDALGRKSDAKQVIQDALSKDANFADAADAKRLLQKL